MQFDVCVSEEEMIFVEAGKDQLDELLLDKIYRYIAGDSSSQVSLRSYQENDSVNSGRRSHNVSEGEPVQ